MFYHLKKLKCNIYWQVLIGTIIHWEKSVQNQKYHFEKCTTAVSSRVIWSSSRTCVTIPRSGGGEDDGGGGSGGGGCRDRGGVEEGNEEAPPPGQ